jgi:hypothetical protein
MSVIGFHRTATIVCSGEMRGPNRSEYAIEAEGQRLGRLKVVDFLKRVDVRHATSPAAHLEARGKVEVDCGLVGRTVVKWEVFENLALLTSRSFAVRTPVKMMHIVLARPEPQNHELEARPSSPGR